MFDRLWEWVREFVDGPARDEVPVELRIVGLAEGWGVAVEVARRIVWEYATQHGIAIVHALDMLQGLNYAEARRELGTN
jgi:hypothetical protein